MSDNEFVMSQSSGETGPIARPAPEAEPSALTDLLARVVDAEGPDRKLERAIIETLGLEWIGGSRPGWWSKADDAWINATVTASLDAALALVERVLPGWGGEIGFGQPPWAFVTSPDYAEPEDFVQAKGFVFASGGYGKPPAKTPALALLAALLKAKIAEAAGPAERPALPRETDQ